MLQHTLATTCVVRRSSSSAPVGELCPMHCELNNFIIIIAVVVVLLLLSMPGQELCVRLMRALIC